MSERQAFLDYLDKFAPRLSTNDRIGIADMADEIYRLTPGDAAEREIATLRAERQWQPIETAPKDGTRILAAPHTAVGSPGWFVAHWGSGHFGGFGGMPGQFKEGWLDGPFFAGPQPTHWQPLPAPPAADALAKGASRDS